jgi:hypothetical protein
LELIAELLDVNEANVNNIDEYEYSVLTKLCPTKSDTVVNGVYMVMNAFLTSKENKYINIVIDEYMNLTIQPPLPGYCKFKRTRFYKFFLNVFIFDQI